jgi:hypothetical protein
VVRADFFTHKNLSGDPDFYEGKERVERKGYITEIPHQTRGLNLFHAMLKAKLNSRSI